MLLWNVLTQEKNMLLYMTELCVVPSHYHAVSLVPMRRIVLDKRQNSEHAHYAGCSDDI